MMAQRHHFHTQVHPQQEEYSIENARRVIALVMCHINENPTNLLNAKAHQFVQSYSQMKALKTFCQLGRVPAFKDMKELYDPVVCKSSMVKDLKELEKQ